jgi:hypothetical protein
MYVAVSPSQPSAAACESALLIVDAESSSSPPAAMPPLETSKMGGLTGGPGTVAASVGGVNGNSNGLADHHLLLAAVNSAAAAAAGGVKKTYAEQTDSELAELATQEISLDLQGLIDDTSPFADDNLFGDLMETAKKNDVNGGVGGSSPQSSWLAMARAATPGSSSGGSSGQNSPGSEGQNSPPSYNIGGGGYHRSAALAYLPGSVHSGASFAQLGHVTQQQQQQQQQQHHHHHHHQNIQVNMLVSPSRDFSDKSKYFPTEMQTSLGNMY